MRFRIIETSWACWVTQGSADTFWQITLDVLVSSDKTNKQRRTESSKILKNDKTEEKQMKQASNMEHKHKRKKTF